MNKSKSWGASLFAIVLAIALVAFPLIALATGQVEYLIPVAKGVAYAVIGLTAVMAVAYALAMYGFNRSPGARENLLKAYAKWKEFTVADTWVPIIRNVVACVLFTAIGHDIIGALLLVSALTTVLVRYGVFGYVDRYLDNMKRHDVKRHDSTMTWLSKVNAARSS